MSWTIPISPRNVKIKKDNSEESFYSVPPAPLNTPVGSLEALGSKIDSKSLTALDILTKGEEPLTSELTSEPLTSEMSAHIQHLSEPCIDL